VSTITLYSKLLIFSLLFQQQPETDDTFSNKDFFNSRLNPRMPQPVRSTTADGYEGNDFGNQFIFDDDNLEKFDMLENSRLKSLIINDESDLRSPLDLIQVL
jgi:hypothetical protein